jgi:hypothetical protein
VAAAVGSAIAAAIGALAVAGRVRACASNVARRRHARKVAGAAALTAAIAVGAHATALSTDVAAHVTRRTLAAELAMAARAAMTFPICTLPAARRIVPRTLEMAGRSEARQRAGFAGTAQAASLETRRRRVVVVATRGQREEEAANGPMARFQATAHGANYLARSTLAGKGRRKLALARSRRSR